MAQLGRHLQTFEALQTQVVVVSFGTPYWVKVWLEETGSPFPLLLDPDRAVYRAFGLERSILRSWGWRSSWYYARAIFSRGEKVIVNRGDTNQLGGDFVVDNAGIFQFTHPSQDPTDRPSIQTIKQILAK